MPIKRNRGDDEGEKPYDLGPDDFVKYVQYVEWMKGGRPVPRPISIPADTEDMVEDVVERPKVVPAVVVPPMYPYTPPPETPEPERTKGGPISGLIGPIGGMAAANTAATLLARRGCLACPVGKFVIWMPWVYPPAFLNILARFNVPHGCSPFIIARVHPLIGVTMGVDVWYCIPIPVAWVLGIASAIGSAVAGAIEAAYLEAIPSLCREFGDRVLRRVVGPCLALIYMDLFLAVITIRACFRKCIDQLEKGLALAKELERQLKVLSEVGVQVPWWAI